MPSQDVSEPAFYWGHRHGLPQAHLRPPLRSQASSMPLSWGGSHRIRYELKWLGPSLPRRKRLLDEEQTLISQSSSLLNKVWTARRTFQAHLPWRVCVVQQNNKHFSPEAILSEVHVNAKTGSTQGICLLCKQQSHPQTALCWLHWFLLPPDYGGVASGGRMSHQMDESCFC